MATVEKIRKDIEKTKEKISAQQDVYKRQHWTCM